jgi:hypothetical protein
MTRLPFSILITAACLSLLPLTGCAEKNQMKEFTERLLVEQQQGRVRVKVSFDNQTDHKVFVANAIAVENDLSNALFEVKENSGADIPYVGMMAKRSPPGPDDYYAIAPHSKHENTIDITDSYAFQAGSHGYKLSYQGTYLQDLNKLDQISSIGTLRAEFIYAK